MNSGLVGRYLTVLDFKTSCRTKTFGGFHFTQVSLIITQVINKIAYHSTNWVKEFKYHRRVINKQRAPSFGDVRYWPNSSFSANGITENYSLKYGDAMLEPVWGTLTFQVFWRTWKPRIYRGARVPQPTRSCHRYHVNKRLSNTREIDSPPRLKLLVTTKKSASVRQADVTTKFKQFEQI